MINFHLLSESVLVEQRLSPTKEHFLLVIPSYLVAEDLDNSDWSTLSSQGSCTKTTQTQSHLTAAQAVQVELNLSQILRGFKR